MMKCPHCKAEWNIPGQTIMPENCPFCGKKLVVKTSSTAHTLEGVLLEIASSFGVDTLKDGRKTLSFFSDLAPQLKKEQLILSHFLDANRGNIENIFFARSQTEAEQKVLFLKLLNKLVDEWAMREDAAALVCRGYFSAVGISIHYEENSAVLKEKTVITQQADSGRTLNNTVQTSGSQHNKTNPPTLSMSNTTQTGGMSQTIQYSAPSGKIDTYAKYLKALEDYFLSCFPNGENRKPLTLSQIEQFIKIYDLKSFWRGSAKDVEADLLKIYHKYGFSGRPILSGTSTSTWSQSKPSTNSVSKTSSTTSKPATRPGKIDTYWKYKQALEKYFLDTFSSGQPKRSLTRQQIEYFINVNSLHSSFGITVKEVETDLQKVYAKYGVAGATTLPPSVKPNPTLSKTITSYNEYINALTNIYLKNGKKILSDSEILNFLRQYDLDRRFGIQIGDVKTDLQSIAQKYR